MINFTWTRSFQRGIKKSYRLPLYSFFQSALRFNHGMVWGFWCFNSGINKKLTIKVTYLQSTRPFSLLNWNYDEIDAGSNSFNFNLWVLLLIFSLLLQVLLIAYSNRASFLKRNNQCNGYTYTTEWSYV